MNIRKICLLTSLAWTVMGAALAQSSGCNSPYSRYGWGMLSDESQGFNKSLGSVALGFRGKDVLNRQNPASYAAIDSMTFLFDVGVSLQYGHWSENGKSVNAHNSTLDYLEAGLRLFKNVGVSIGMRPISIVGYNFNTTQTLPDNDGYGEKTATSTFEGSGGVRQAWLGLGWQIFKPLSVGVNAGYIWGDYQHNSSLTYNETNIQNLARMYKGSINTYSLDFGLQYETKFGKKDVVSIGATFGLGHEMKGKSTFINQKRSSSSVVGADTSYTFKSFELPTSYAAGITWRHAEQLTIGLDYVCQLWKDCKFPQLNENNNSMSYFTGTGVFRNKNKMALGVEYIPQPEGMRITDHICYRVGASYSTSYININQHSGPKEYLVSVGIGLPLVNKYNTRSTLNVALQWQRFSPSTDQSIKEDYFKLCLGLSFNANWFNKWKIE